MAVRVGSLTHGELFTGISGFGLGFERAGIKTAWHVEIDRDCQKVLRHHYPNTLLLSDIRECGTHNLPPVDIITFGSPCQDLSIAGKRKGLDGERSGLFFEAIRIVAELKPNLAVWENVPGALSANAGRDFTAVLTAFRECGARDIAWRILDARYFGVAQRRRRVFLVADFRGERAAEILFESESVPRHPAPRRETGQGTANGFEVGPSGNRFTDLSPTLDTRARDGPMRNQIGVGVMVITERTRNGERNLEWQDDLAYALDNPGDGGRAQTRLIAYSGNNTSGPIDVATAQNVHGGTGRHDFESEVLVVNGNSTPETARDLAFPLRSNDGSGNRQAVAMTPQGTWDISPTLRTHYGKDWNDPSNPSGPLVKEHQNTRIRRLSPIECLRLQGFPDDWLDLDPPLSDSAKYRMVGNAVAVPCA